MQSDSCIYNVELTLDMTTIIRVKYIESLSKNNDIGDLEATSMEAEMLVNINCPIRMILDYIRKTASLDNTCEFDLCDEINCQLKNVSLYEPCTRGTDILQPNLTYYIITFERDEHGQMINLTPILTGKTAKRCDILTKMRRSSRKTPSIKSKNSNNVLNNSMLKKNINVL